MIKTDIGNLSERLFKKAIDCLTFGNIYQYNNENKELIKNPKFQNNPIPWITQYWIVFSAGIEFLLKSKLVLHDCLNIERKHIFGKDGNPKLNKSALNYEQCFTVYNYINSLVITVENNNELKSRVTKRGISLLYELDLGTLGNCKNLLLKLKEKGILSENESADFFNSVQVLSDVRRNFDIHNVSPINVLGSINGDLDNLYLPMINILLKK